MLWCNLSVCSGDLVLLLLCSWIVQCCTDLPNWTLSVFFCSRSVVEVGWTLPTYESDCVVSAVTSMHSSDGTDICVGNVAHDHTLPQAHSQQCKRRSRVSVLSLSLSGVSGQWEELFWAARKNCVWEAVVIITRYQSDCRPLALIKEKGMKNGCTISLDALRVNREWRQKTAA